MHPTAEWGAVLGAKQHTKAVLFVKVFVHSVWVLRGAGGWVDVVHRVLVPCSSCLGDAALLPIPI